MNPECPRCQSRETVEEAGFEEGFEERLDMTHRCSACQKRFKFIPPLAHRIEVHPAIAERLWGIK